MSNRFDITFPFSQTAKIIELGGGDNPRFRPNVDIRPGPTVDFVCDLNSTPGIAADQFHTPLALGSYDGVYSSYAIEHVSWRNVHKFIELIYALLKEGGRAFVIAPNLVEQAKLVVAKAKAGELTDNEICCVFGDQNYAGQDWRANSHTAGFSPETAIQAFRKAGFVDVIVIPHPATDTDMIIEARKPTKDDLGITMTDKNKRPIAETLAHEDGHSAARSPLDVNAQSGGQSAPFNTAPDVSEYKEHEQQYFPVKADQFTTEQRAEAYGQEYFNGGGEYGGYAREGYWDYPVHDVTAQKILSLKPESVLELGCARGYLLKRFEDAGIPVTGFEISEHCYQTRAVADILKWDFTRTPWPFINKQFDLCISNAVMEHVPERYLPAIKAEIERVCKRSLHGVSFKDDDDGFDKTHTTLHDEAWWRTQLPGLVVNKEDLERADANSLPVITNDGLTKLNFGCFRTMFGHGWVNIDQHSLHDFAIRHGYKFSQMDARYGITVIKDDTVDLIYHAHFLEHLNYEHGYEFLKHCYRIMKPGATMRIIVPDASLIMGLFMNGPISKWKQIVEGLFPKDKRKLPPMMLAWEMICQDHASSYDADTLTEMLATAGFSNINRTKFRVGNKKILSETTDSLPEISLYMEVTK